MKTSEELRIFKRRMKRKPTIHEGIFLERLEKEKIDFKSQMILGFYILDFMIPSKMLVIEIDGKSHNEYYDFKRDKFIKECGFFVLRIKNEDVEKYDFNKIIKILPNKTIKEFRSGLGKANSIKGVCIKSNKIIRKKDKQGLPSEECSP